MLQSQCVVRFMKFHVQWKYTIKWKQSTRFNNFTQQYETMNYTASGSRNENGSFAIIIIVLGDFSTVPNCIYN